jgi:hypothetical protein
MDIFILLTEKNRVRLRERVKGLENAMQWQWAFWTVEYESALRRLGGLRFSRLEDAGSPLVSRLTVDVKVSFG